MSEKKRLDQLLVDRGLAPSREKAKALIMAGQVYVQNQKSDKPGTSYTEAVEIEVRGSGLAYVSRGGLKLERRCGCSRSVYRIKLLWILAPLPEALLIVCCKTALKRCTL